MASHDAPRTVRNSRVLWRAHANGADGDESSRRVENGFVPGSRARLALPGDERAIFTSDDDDHLILATPMGETRQLDCHDYLGVRVDSERRRIVCIEVESSSIDRPEDDLSVTVKTFDYAGDQKSRIDTKIPAGTLPRSYYVHFPGFLEDGTPVLSVHVDPVHETFAPGQLKLCAAFAVRGGAVTKLAEIESTSWPDCGEASFWNSHTEVELERGEELE